MAEGIGRIVTNSEAPNAHRIRDIQIGKLAATGKPASQRIAWAAWWNARTVECPIRCNAPITTTKKSASITAYSEIDCPRWRCRRQRTTSLSCVVFTSSCNRTRGREEGTGVRRRFGMELGISGLRAKIRSQFSASPETLYIARKWRQEIAYGAEDGAGDGDRTRDIQLGKLAFYR